MQTEMLNASSPSHVLDKNKSLDLSKLKSPKTENGHVNYSSVPKWDSQIKIVEVETLFIGGGPATLGVLSNAFQTSRIEELVLGPPQPQNGLVGPLNSVI